MNEEIKNIKKVIKELKIDVKDIKSIEIKWERIFKDKAFPKIKIEFK